MPKKKAPVALGAKILELRGQRVMLDTDLAALYGVPTKRLNEQVKRNLARFPAEFMFQLTAREKAEVVANCDHLKHLKFSSQRPRAFTDYGALMLANVLKSDRAIKVSIEVIRSFTRLREAVSLHRDLARRLLELEKRVAGHDEGLRQVFAALKAMLAVEEKPRPRIGFV